MKNVAFKILTKLTTLPGTVFHQDAPMALRLIESPDRMVTKALLDCVDLKKSFYANSRHIFLIGPSIQGDLKRTE